MNLILTDIKSVRDDLLPLTFTRPVAMLRTGIGTIADHWQRLLPHAAISFRTEDYLQGKYPCNASDPATDITMAGHIIPTVALAEAIAALGPGQWIADAAGQCIAECGNRQGQPTATVETKAILQPYHIFELSKELITADFHAVTAGRVSQPVSPTCTVIGDPSLIFIEEGADVEGCLINTRQGPVYIGAGAEVQETAVLRGPVCVGPDCLVRIGARLLPGTNLGPKCKVGGEIDNAIFLANANKQHDGYLGDAVIGEWCNLGAGCTASNLKNTYGTIKLWSMGQGRFVDTGLQFCGLIMGDHSKAGINTMFNTATTVGVGVNFYGAGFPRTFIPSFTQGSTAGMKPVFMDAFFETAAKVMARRHIELTQMDKDILYSLYSQQ